MGNLTTALSSALQGMSVVQRELSVTSSNIANAGNSDYTRKVVQPEVRVFGDSTAGVRVGGVTRQLDIFVQNQLRYNSSDLHKESVRLNMMERLEMVFGTVGDDSSLNGRFDRFVNAMQMLNASPEDPSLQSQVLDEAVGLAAELNRLSDEVQSLRSEADNALESMVEEANLLLKDLEKVNNEVKRDQGSAMSNPDNLDRRDAIISRLSEMMDLEVIRQSDGGVLLHTRGGATIFSQERVILEYDSVGVISPQSTYSTKEAERTIGTMKITTSSGSTVDLFAQGYIRSGQIKSYLEMRDETLVQAQAQLDEMAAFLSRSLSDIRYEGQMSEIGGDNVATLDTTAFPENGAASVTALPEGTEWDMGFKLTSAAGTSSRYNIRFIHNSSIASPGFEYIDKETTSPFFQTITLDMSDPAAIAAALNANTAFTSQGLNTFNTTAGTSGGIVSGANVGPGSTFSIQDMASAAGARLEITSSQMSVLASANLQNSAATGAVTQLPFFTDSAGKVYQGETYADTNGNYFNDKLGFAGRIQVNPELLRNSDALNIYDITDGAQTPTGDSSRILTMIDALTSDEIKVAPTTGLGTTQAPFNASLSMISQRIVSNIGYAVSAQQSAHLSIETRYNAIEERFNEVSAVSVDEEMAMLIQLEQAFAANAKVVSATDELMQMILQMV